MKKRIILGLIIVLAIVTRFWKLGTYPALNADEAAIGYNAYSLIQTGKDEHGNPWPVHFQSFNDYKPGLFFYVVLPFVKLFGLNAWSVRMPGAALGVLTILVIYLLCLKIGSWKLGLIASALLAVSPWHIHFSRGGWEVNTATFLITLGILLFVGKKYLWSMFLFVLSLYDYHAARVVVPLLGLGLVAIYWKEIRENLRKAVSAGIIGALLLVPIAKDLTEVVSSRASGVGIFADQGPYAKVLEQRGEHGKIDSLGARLLHNRPVNYTLAFLENLVSHYGGNFLFVSGDEIQRNKVPNMGQAYLVTFPFVLIGLVAVIKKFGKGEKLMLFWLLIAPVASALTFQSPHALRAHNMVIPLTILTAIGLSRLRGRSFQAVIWSLIVLSFGYYLKLYWVDMSRVYPFSSQYGVKELVEFIKEEGGRYDKIVVTDRYDQPYILFLFYLKYPPQKFQKNHVLTKIDKYGFSTVRYFDKYIFESIDLPITKQKYPNSLIIGTPEEMREEDIIEEIYGSNGYKYFEVVKN